MNIPILYEDYDLLVINKPAGISVHTDGRNKEVTITDWIIENYPMIKGVGEPIKIEDVSGKNNKIDRPGIVHRLDKETSGALIIVKNQKAFDFIKNQFMNHKVIKVYQAFVYGFVSDPKASLLTNKKGVINTPIGRSPNNIRMWTAGRGARPPLRDALTEYIILNKFEDQKNGFSFLELYPKTGRTHQIRVHLRYINHPIVSDPLYRGSREMSLGIKRLALHAKKITFSLLNGETITIEAPYPNDFQKIVDHISSK